MTTRPLLTAAWRNLVLLNFRVPTEVIQRLAPPGTEPDLHNDQSYISIVGFRFENVRLFGIPIPGHTNFPEINLRYYVRRTVDGELRRGVVFIREIVPRRAVTIVANTIYNESYVTRPTRSEIQVAGPTLAPGDALAYTWQTAAQRLWFSKSAAHENRLSAEVAAPLVLPPAGSLEEFIVEHYWGYTRGRDGQTREYQVAHVPWRVAPADNVEWKCNIAANYSGPFAEYLSAPPASTIIAEGSDIKVYRGHRC